MKKILTVILALTLCASALAFAGCDKAPANEADDKTIVVGASSTPHAEILEVCKDILAEKDITLDIVEFTDYVQPNNVVESGEIDANYFQHTPYLEDFNAENGTHLVVVSIPHVEPLGIYGGQAESLDAIK